VASGVVRGVRLDFWSVGEDYPVFVRVGVGAVGEEFGHIVDIGVAAAEGVGGVGVVDADEEGLFAAVGHGDESVERSEA
jgi:hypothetical protein